MQIRFNRKGNERKTLVSAISEILGTKPVYRGAPTFSYDINGLEVDKEGTLIYDDGTEKEIIETLLEKLISRGFDYETHDSDQKNNTDSCELLVIEMPKEGFTDIAYINLEKLIKSKGDLIKKALGITELPVNLESKILRSILYSEPMNPSRRRKHRNAYLSFSTSLAIAVIRT